MITGSIRKMTVSGSSVAAAIVLSILALVSPMSAQAAQGHFECRASALRLNLPLGLVVEPVAANSANNPCATDSQAVLSFLNDLGIRTGTLVAKTNDAPLPVYARAKVEKVNVGNLLNLVNLRARAIRANAHVSVTQNGKCRLHSGSSLVGLAVQGQNFATLNTPLDLDVKLLGLVVAKLHLNATLGGKHPTIGKPDATKVTQRAVWLHVTDPALQAVLGDLIMGEASVSTVGNPCA